MIAKCVVLAFCRGKMLGVFANEQTARRWVENNDYITQGEKTDTYYQWWEVEKDD